VAHIGQSDQYDIVHVQTVWDGYPLVKLRDSGRGAAGRRRFKLVYQPLGLAHLDLPVRQPGALDDEALEQLKADEADLLRLADAVLCPSRAGRVYLQDLGVQPRRVTLLPDGFDPAQFPAGEWRPFGKTPTLLYIGAFDTWAGLEVVLRALPLIHQVHKVKLRLVGALNQAERETVQAQVKALKLTRQVAVEEAVAYETWPEIIADADICLAPQALDERNLLIGLPHPALAAYMGAGRPIVGTDLPAMREMLRPGVDGLLVGPDSPEDFASAARRLIEDERLARQLALSAGQYARAHYTWAGLHGRLLNLYETLAAATRSRRR
jgi:glycosyltransferase involved in cell wall biosynthesis